MTRVFNLMRKSIIILFSIGVLSACSSGGSYLSALSGKSKESVTQETTEAAEQTVSPALRSFCPLVESRAGAETYRLHQGEAGPKNVRAQLHINDVRRKCSVVGSETVVSVVVSGTVIKGPKSNSDRYTGPIRLVVVDRNFEPIVGGLRKLEFIIPVGTANTTFSKELEALTIPTTDPDILKGYQIFIGFDGREE